MEAELDDLIVPQNRVTPTLWALAVAVVASFVVSLQVVQSSQGQITSFKDYGVLLCAGAALLLAPVVLKEATSPLAQQHRAARLGMLALLSIVALARFAYGLGVFA